MSILSDDNNLTLKQFFKKMLNDLKIIIIYGIIILGFIWGVFSVIEWIGV